MHDVPKDLGRRIVEATRLAVAMHLQGTAEPFSPQLGSNVGGADCHGGAVLDGGCFAPAPAIWFAATLAEGEAE